MKKLNEKIEKLEEENKKHVQRIDEIVMENQEREDEILEKFVILLNEKKKIIA